MSFLVSKLAVHCCVTMHEGMLSYDSILRAIQYAHCALKTNHFRTLYKISRGYHKPGRQCVSVCSNCSKTQFSKTLLQGFLYNFLDTTEHQLSILILLGFCQGGIQDNISTKHYNLSHDYTIESSDCQRFNPFLPGVLDPGNLQVMLSSIGR